MHEFVAAAFGKRLRFGLPLGVEARFVVQGARLTCRRCQARTQILKAVEVEAGPDRARLSVSALGRRPGLWDSIRPRLPSSFPSSSIRPRFSKIQGLKQLSNGCSHCGAPIGEDVEHEARDESYVISEFVVPLEEPWRGALLPRGRYGRLVRLSSTREAADPCAALSSVPGDAEDVASCLHLA